jgi:hypothetical protein
MADTENKIKEKGEDLTIKGTIKETLSRELFWKRQIHSKLNLYERKGESKR